MKLLQALNFRHRGTPNPNLHPRNSHKGCKSYAPPSLFYRGVAVGQVSGILCSFAATPHLLLQRENGIVFYVFAYAKMHMNGVEKGGGKVTGKVARWVRKWLTYFGDNPTKMAHIFRLLPCASFAGAL